MAHDQVLRTGVLFKKGSGQGPFGRRNWKPRYFLLTPAKLSYFTYEDGELKGELDLTRCNEQSLEVMPVDSMKTGSSASTIWRVAINSPDRRLLIAANTEVEMNDWVEQFRNAFRINSGQPVPMPPQRAMYGQHPQAPGAVTTTGGNEGGGIIDFQNFAAARRSVGGAMRASAGAYNGHELRLSEDLIRHQQAEHERLEAERKAQEIEAARLREEEIRRVEMLKGEQTAVRESTGAELADAERREVALEAQRLQRREEHERQRLEREQAMREQDEQRMSATQAVQVQEEQRMSATQAVQVQEEQRMSATQAVQVQEEQSWSASPATTTTTATSFTDGDEAVEEVTVTRTTTTETTTTTASPPKLESAMSSFEI